MIYGILMSLDALKFTSAYLWLFVVLLISGCTQGELNNLEVEGGPLPAVNSGDLSTDERGAIARQKCMEYSQYASDSKCPPSIIGNKQSENVLGSVGKSRAAPMEFPHMVALGHQFDGDKVSWICGGTLISETFVLTTAICVNSTLGRALLVRVGDLNLERSDDGAMPEERRVIERIAHPESSPYYAYHDIALLRLESPVPFNDWIRPACLYTASYVKAKEAVATGWGRLDPNAATISPDLMKVTLPLVDLKTCEKSWPAEKEGGMPNDVIGDWVICAGAKGKDTCQGDAGGPLAIRRFGKKKDLCIYDVIGVTSFGQSCGTGTPALYARVYDHIPWIESIVWGREQ